MDLHKARRPSHNVHINHEGEHLDNTPHNDEEDGNGVLIHWQGPEFEHFPKEKIWYTVVALFLSAIIIYALFTNSPIMAITFVLIGIVGYIQLERFPKVVDFKVTHDGIIIGKELYDFNTVKSFWIFYEPPHTKVLSLHTDALLAPYVHVPVHQIDPVELREILLEFVPEIKQEPTFVDTLERFFRI